MEMEKEELLKREEEEKDVLLEGLEEQEEEENEEVELKAKGTFTFSKPIPITEEETLKKVEYDFESITPATYNNICKEVGKKTNLTIPELNQNVQFTLFCRAAHQPVSLLKKALLQDFVAMCALARDFLLYRQDGEEEEDIL